MDSLSHLIGKRLRLARDQSSRSQEEVAAALGLKDRQSISAIEVGERKITSNELIKAGNFFGKSLEFFTDPYFVAESNAFSYRAKTLDGALLKEFAERAERLISTQRRFRSLLGEQPSPIHPQLRNVTKSTSFSVAALNGEQTAAGWELGPIPAQKLRDVAEDKLGISILFVDGNTSISGAACRLDDGDVILVNRSEPEARRNFNIGHEIFHLLTWEAMPPAPLDYESENGSPKKSRSEQLADSYSGGLLMPSSIVLKRWERGNVPLAEWLRHHANELLVSPLALYWRLVNLGLVSKKEQPFPAGVSRVKRSRSGAQTPRLYNRAFVCSLQQVLHRGHLSVLRATEVLDCSIQQLVQLFESYELEVPFGY